MDVNQDSAALIQSNLQITYLDLKVSSNELVVVVDTLHFIAKSNRRIRIISCDPLQSG